MKKVVLSMFASLLLAFAVAQQHSLEKLWETDSLLKVPEGVLPDIKNKVLYVSNIAGTDPWAKDNNGSIGKVGLDGTIIQAEWIRGLNSPKGMGMYKNTLYVADLTEIVVIDLQKGEIRKRITVPNAEGLNDITVDPKGVVYVSDSKTKRVYMLKGDNVNPHLEGLQGPNGVLWHKENLYVLDKGGLYRVEYDRKLTKLADGMEGGTDGVEPVYDKEFIVSCWAGAIYYIYPDGTKELLLDTRNDKKNTADIGYDPATRIIYVPTFWKNSVVAYQLK
ncbi:MAG: SMP-30/gluconolactonase/LRE family protein [Chitinophagaceae bacterium]|nr:SMP-30/gluconolactonase/LRE family protein [Chitinophagaceae bacterium]